ncbi:hypothetical protein ACH5RR_001150 [Cinchona calisaya]|uniref:Uncharacterized protein n=1 Tax=Cinchona calisaya TaxID=153742 RepID=A0ABD3B3S8_9GENT
MFNKIGVLDSLRGRDPLVSQCLGDTSNLLDATLKAVDNKTSDSMGLSGTSHRVVSSKPLSQTIISAAVTQVMNCVFSSQVAHDISNSIGVGIKNTNANGISGSSQQVVDGLGSNGISGSSQQLVDGFGSTLNGNSRSNTIADSQDNILQSAHPGSQLSGDGPDILMPDKLDLLWDDIQNFADQNKKNRATHGPAHRTGRIAHATIRQEDQMIEKLSQIPTLEQTIEVKQHTFREVMGSECRGYSAGTVLHKSGIKLGSQKSVDWDSIMTKAADQN